VCVCVQSLAVVHYGVRGVRDFDRYSRNFYFVGGTRRVCVRGNCVMESLRCACVCVWAGACISNTYEV